jgi:hypothetical protein
MAQSPELEKKVAALGKKVRTLEIAAFVIFLLNILARL